MKQAKYDPESQGHFGLAAEFYTHFTSPIRRYPDLVIHRIIREVIENGGQLSDAREEYLASRMQDIADQSSERERVAVEAERDTEALKKAEFMLDKIGEEFTGIISSVTSFGMFVELDNTVEGLIRLSYMTDDYYHFHEPQMALIGERTSKIYRIGDEVRVRVLRVNMDEHTIDFELVEAHRRQEVPHVIFEARKGRKGGGGRGERGGRGRDRDRDRDRGVGYGAAGRGGVGASYGGGKARRGSDGREAGADGADGGEAGVGVASGAGDGYVDFWGFTSKQGRHGHGAGGSGGGVGSGKARSGKSKNGKSTAKGVRGVSGKASVGGKSDKSSKSKKAKGSRV